MSDKLFDHAVRAWLEHGSDRTPPTTIDAVLLAVKTTPQERDLRLPRRYNLMPTYLRLAAGIAIVAIVGVGVLAFNMRPPGYGTSSPVPPTATPAPSAAVPSAVAPGISGWTVYKPEASSLTLGYPSDWRVLAPASRQWKDSDTFPSETQPYAHIFVSPAEGDEQIGMLAWNVTVGVLPKSGKSELATIDGFKAWARSFCEEALSLDCGTFTDAAVPMCDNANVREGTYDPCKAAILVPTADWQFAFLRDRTAEWVGWDAVHVVVVAREDNFPSAAPYGGSVQLLKSILTTLDVWTPGEHPKFAGWIDLPGTQ